MIAYCRRYRNSQYYPAGREFYGLIRVDLSFDRARHSDATMNE